MHVIRNKNHGGFIDLQCKGVGMEEEDNRVLYFSFLCSKLIFVLCTQALANVFEKNEKKNKMSLYRLLSSVLLNLQFFKRLKSLGKEYEIKGIGNLGGRGVILGWECATGTRELLAYTTPSSGRFCNVEQNLLGQAGKALIYLSLKLK